MNCTNYHQALILCLFVVSSLVTNAKFKPHRSASYDYKSQVYPVVGLSNTFMIYVAGEMITIVIPPEVESNLKAIIEWKVLNTDENRLIFISNYNPYIMIDKKVIRGLKRMSGYFTSGQMIILGDSKAIQARIVDNAYLHHFPNDPPGSYLDLLYFNAEKEELEIIDQILWRSDQDGDHIVFYGMIDHIFIGDKLYIAISREIGKRTDNDEVEAKSQISIMRLCLDQGNYILSSAVEVYFERQSSFNRGHFVFKLGQLDDESKRFSLLVERTWHSRATYGIHDRYFIANYSTIFDEVAVNCAQGVKGYSLMHDVITLNETECQPKDVTKCFFPKYYIPSLKLNITDELVEPNTMHSLIVVHDGYPFNETRYLFREGNFFKECSLSQVDATSFNCTSQSHPQNLFYYHYFNYITSTTFWLDESGTTFTFTSFDCFKFKNCFNCIMFGYHSMCTWNGVNCVSYHYSVTINVTTLSVDYCAKITKFKPKSVSSTTKLKQFFIDFDGFPWNQSVDLKVYGSIGPNPCYNIITDYSPNAMYKIICDLVVETRGTFHINLTFVYEHYANLVPIVAISEGYVTFVKSVDDDMNTIMIAQYFALFLVLLFFSIAVALVLCSQEKKRRKRRKQIISEISSKKSNVKSSMITSPRRYMARGILGKEHKTMTSRLKLKEFLAFKGKHLGSSSSK